MPSARAAGPRIAKCCCRPKSRTSSFCVLGLGVGGGGGGNDGGDAAGPPKKKQKLLAAPEAPAAAAAPDSAGWYCSTCGDDSFLPKIVCTISCADGTEFPIGLAAIRKRVHVHAIKLKIAELRGLHQSEIGLFVPGNETPLADGFGDTLPLEQPRTWEEPVYGSPHGLANG